MVVLPGLVGWMLVDMDASCDQTKQENQDQKAMPVSKPSRRLAAILMADIHSSIKPPIARSAEKDWFEVQRRYWKQVTDLLQDDWSVPIIVAGDVFHKPDNPAELVNFLMEFMPTVYAIPGQHDLPYHRYTDLYKSSFWTLVKAGKITNIDPHEPLRLAVNGEQGKLMVYGFPYGYKPEPLLQEADSKIIHLAAVHSYIWKKGYSYATAPKKATVGKFLSRLKGYTAAVFGDNHKGFLWKKDGFTLLNVGGFIRRNVDEMDYRPSVGLLYDDGSIKRHFLDVSLDKWIDVHGQMETIAGVMNLEKVFDELEDLGQKTVDFIQVVHEWMDKNNVTGNVRQFIIQALQRKRK